MQSEKLIELLLKQTNALIAQAENLKSYSLQDLSWKENAQSWSILECLEHLNRYGEFYLPLIQKQIENSKEPNQAIFKSGILGGYFAKSMLPKDKLNKMKTFKDKNPLNCNLDISVIDTFINQQKLTIELLNNSKNVNLNKIKIATTISKRIKLKLGDTFQFIINHILRHFKEIERIQTSMKELQNR